MTETLPLVTLEEEETLLGIEWRIMATRGHEGVCLSLVGPKPEPGDAYLSARKQAKDHLKARMTELLRHMGWIQ